LAHILRKELGKRILGPAEPQVARINNVYNMNIMIKMEKNPRQIQVIKQFILNTIKEVKSKQGFSGIRVNVNVDPL
jgi:primosomal protein N' (replication factor Y)